jgi:hypothetical protein
MTPHEQKYNAEHIAGTTDLPETLTGVRKRRPSRHQRVTITQAILLFVFTLVLCQLWLFTATLNAYLGGDQSVVWPGAIASLACLGLNVGLLRYLYWMEHPAASTEH